MKRGKAGKVVSWRREEKRRGEGNYIVQVGGKARENSPRQPIIVRRNFLCFSSSLSWSSSFLLFFALTFFCCINDVFFRILFIQLTFYSFMFGYIYSSVPSGYLLFTSKILTQLHTSWQKTVLPYTMKLKPTLQFPFASEKQQQQQNRFTKGNRRRTANY